MANSAPPPAPAALNPDRKSGAGATPNPWEACAMLKYGGDRTLASAVREQVAATPPEGRVQVEDRLLQALGLPGCTDAGRAFICQMLALVGSARSVTMLAPMLRDAKTADDARYALQPIPGPEVDTALRNALGALSGRTKAGLIGSIAMRGDSAARPALNAIKADAAEPPLVREAATRALERLSTLHS